MTNNIYQQLISELSSIFGSHHQLESGTGVRFQSSKKGKLTIYHRNISTGNAAEIAFELESLAARFGLTMPDTLAFLTKLRAATGRPVEINPRYQWPRVGIATTDDVNTVVQMLKVQLAI